MSPAVLGIIIWTLFFVGVIVVGINLFGKD